MAAPIPNFTEIRPLEDSLIYADTHRRMDRRGVGRREGRTDIRTDIAKLTRNKRRFNLGLKHRADDYKIEAMAAGYCAGFGGFVAMLLTALLWAVRLRRCVTGSRSFQRKIYWKHRESIAQ